MSSVWIRWSAPVPNDPFRTAALEAVSEKRGDLAGVWVIDMRDAYALRCSRRLGADSRSLDGSQLLRHPLCPADLASTIVNCCSVEGAALNGSVVNAAGGFSAWVAGRRCPG
jgi:hypothetical protein